MEEIIRIDGSQGEGGGQVLRTSLAMSAVCGRPVEIENVRAKRKTPGLRRQHLTCLRAAAEVCSAEIEGDEVGSQHVLFRPGKIKPGSYRFEIGTAGSVTLVAQTVLPILLAADGESEVTITGGTQVPMSPTWDYFEKTFIRQLRRMGAEVTVRIVKYGFYPAGGGEAVIKIKPWKNAVRYELLEKGSLKQARTVARVANLHPDIATSEVEIVRKGLSDLDIKSQTETVESVGPGNYCILELVYDNVTEIASEVGTYDKSRKAVANTVVSRARSYLKSGSAADVYLSDQLLLPILLAADRMPEGEVCWGRFTMPKRHSLHFDTNWEVLKKFRDDCEMREKDVPGNEHAIEVQIIKKGS